MGDQTQQVNCRIWQNYRIPGMDHCHRSDWNNQSGFRKCDGTFPSSVAWRTQTHMVPQREHSRNLLYSVTTKKLPVCHQSQFVSLGYTVFFRLFCLKYEVSLTCDYAVVAVLYSLSYLKGSSLAVRAVLWSSPQRLPSILKHQNPPFSSKTSPR